MLPELTFSSDTSCQNHRSATYAARTNLQQQHMLPELTFSNTCCHYLLQRVVVVVKQLVQQSPNRRVVGANIEHWKST